MYGAAARPEYARVAIVGPPKSGRTRTGLYITKALAGPDAEIYVVDTMGNIGVHTHDDRLCKVAVPRDGDPRRLSMAIQAAAAARARCLMVDTLSACWEFPGGTPDTVDAFIASGVDKATAWRQALGFWQASMTELMTFPGHVVCTLLGTHTTEGSWAITQRKGIESYFQSVGYLNEADHSVVWRSSFPAVDFFKLAPGEEASTKFARGLLRLLSN